MISALQHFDLHWNLCIYLTPDYIKYMNISIYMNIETPFSFLFWNKWKRNPLCKRPKQQTRAKGGKSLKTLPHIELLKVKVEACMVSAWFCCRVGQMSMEFFVKWKNKKIVMWFCYKVGQMLVEVFVKWIKVVVWFCHRVGWM